MKTLFLLFLSLPQTQVCTALIFRAAHATDDLGLSKGSTWIYKAYLEPYFSQNEADIDAGIASAQTQTVVFMQTKLSVLWDALASFLNRTAAARGQSAPASPQPGAAPNVPAQNGQPVASPWMESAKGLWSAYGPAVVGAIQRQTPRAAPAQATTASPLLQSPPIGRATAFQAQPGTPGLDPRKVPLPPSGERTCGFARNRTCDSLCTFPAMPTPSNLSDAPPFPMPQYH